MKEFETFGQLKKLSNAILIQSNNKEDIYRICWQHTMQLVEAIKTDIDSLFDTSCYIAETRFIIEDSFYRQGASAVRFEIRFEWDETLTVVAECLIDVGRAWLRVKNRSFNRRFDYVADKIESNYNSEFLTDIKQVNR